MKTRLFCAVLAALSCSAMQAAADQRYDDSETERFSLKLGTFSVNESNVTVRIDSSRGILGTVIDFEDTLDVQTATDVGRLDGYYRFNPRHRIDFSYFKIERDGTTTLLEDLDFGDELFEAGGVVDTVHNSEILKVSYSYSFIHVSQFEFGIGAGLHTTKITLGLDVPDIGQEERVDGTAPLPVFNFRGRFNFTPKWSMRGKFEWFTLEFDDYEGAFTDSLLSLEHQTFKNVGFGIGVNRLNMEVTAKDGDLRGEINTSTDGYLLFANIVL
jgi:hypothetical protein